MVFGCRESSRMFSRLSTAHVQTFKNAASILMLVNQGSRVGEASGASEMIGNVVSRMGSILVKFSWIGLIGISDRETFP